MPKSKSRCGWANYADLLAVVHERPGTAADIAARSGMNLRALREVLRGLRDGGLIHEGAWRECQPAHCGQRWQAVWTMHGPPALRPGPLRPPVPAPRMPRLAAFCRVVLALMTCAHTPASLADASGATVDRLRPLLYRLCHALRLIRVERWHTTSAGSWPAPAYRWGPNRKNAPRPKARPASEAWKRQHQIRRDRLFWVHMIFLTAGAKPA